MSPETLAKSDSKGRKRLVILDAHAVIHRAYHALPDFSTSKGEPTGAIYGLATMLMKIIEELKPDYIVAAFDLPGKTHRHEVYEAYKGTRTKTDDALKIQLERAKDLFKAWGVPIYSHPGFEADDILGTVVELLKKDKETEIVIASGDMDTLSLVDGKRVLVYTLRKGLNDTILYDESKVNERFGFGPELLPDYKGLRGDTSDNIIGVKGIGEKTATTLIQTFGTVEKMYKALKKGEYKKAGLTERVRDLLLANEEEALFSKTLATIRRDAPIEFKLPKPWKEELDIERLTNFFHELEFRTLPERVKRLISNEGKSLGKSEEPKFVTPDPVEAGEDRELLLALWVVDSNITNPTMDDVFSFTKTKNIKDAWKVINTELDKRKLRSVFEDIERPLIPILEEMNRHGVMIDKTALTGLSREYHKRLSNLESEIHKIAGEEFNINSPRQLGEILFTKMGLGVAKQKKTASGGFSTKESELEKLKDKHPIISLILDYRELQKLLSTYIDSIPKELDKESRLHSSFIQAGTTTGRMASQNPNLQNIPIRTELGRAIRKAFVAPQGYKLLSLDYSQIELRIAAILANDKKLIEIFKNGEDVHTGVAMRVFGVEAGEVDKSMRAKAKTINFGVLFGMGVNALRANLKTSRAEAQEFYNQYFKTFKELAMYIDSVKADAQRKGYTETFFGRRRYFEGLSSSLPFVKAQAERMAFNAPIQGTEADIVKIAMKRIDQSIDKNGWRGKVHALMQVHDEIVYEVREDLVKEVGEEFKKIMERVFDDRDVRGVPIVADAHVGDNWDDMENL